MKKIALVDHDQARGQVEEALAGPGDFQVHSCPLAGDTLACVRQVLPDVVLVFLESPQVAGLNLLRLLRDDPATVNVPVVLGSPRAPAVQPLLDELQRLGIYVLYQPFTAAELRAAVEQALSHRQTD